VHDDAVDDALLAVLYVAVLGVGWASGGLLGTDDGIPPRRPWATVAALVLVGVPSVVQLVVAPGLLDALGRRPAELGDGQPWRLVTSLVVQDGGWAGTAFNLGALAVVGAVAERYWGPARWWAVWLVAGIGAQFWGLVVQPYGGGNSVATFGLAASLALAALLRGTGRARVAGAVTLLGGLALLALRDVHGGAVVLGAGTALALTVRQRSRTA
jgi:membrane associated rhomboid family serine protease